MGHEAVRSRAVPVLLARLEEDAVAWADHLDRAAAPLAEADAFEDVDRLAVRVRVPRGTRARSEVDAARAQARPARRRGDRVDVHRPGEPLGGSGYGFAAVPRDLHAASSSSVTTGPASPLLLG